MSYIVKLWDKTEIILSDNQAEPIKRAKLEGIKAVSINGNVYDTSSIAQIVKSGTSIIDNDKSLSQGKFVDHRGTISSERFNEMRKQLLEKISGKK